MGLVPVERWSRGSRLHVGKPQWWPSAVSCIFLVLTIARRRQTPPGRSNGPEPKVHAILIYPGGENEHRLFQV